MDKIESNVILTELVFISNRLVHLGNVIYEMSKDGRKNTEKD